MKHVLEWIPLSRNEDVPRFIHLIEEAFKRKELKKTKLFDKTKGKVCLLSETEKEEAEAMGDLKSKILAKRAEASEALIDQLMKKYGGGESAKEVSEEEFSRASKKLGPKTIKKHSRRGKK